MFENTQQQAMEHEDVSMPSWAGSSTVSHNTFNQQQGQQQNRSRSLASYRKSKKTNLLKTHIVIGGEHTAASRGDDDDDMDMDMDVDEIATTTSSQHHSQHAQVSFTPTRTLEMQQQYQYESSSTSVSRMEGVETGPQLPLIVMDGANIAHAYSQAKAALYDHQYSQRLTLSSVAAASSSYQNDSNDRRQPDVEGIKVAVDYFLSCAGAQCRVMVVLPSYWLRTKPRAGDYSQGNAKMITPQLESLHELHAEGLLCCAPPADDDDSYIISIARRADTRSSLNGGGGGFILSNDMFRDAIERDNNAGGTGLDKWLNGESRSKDKLG
eukprot:CAMPEP_0196827622 /NCGR_PEP_ID=MMETSP1362-20130617/94254_1 /TAXON_ID=163516 /ORGANISM="Leptocylindrus danicus, Strain CCMP1856" /LENGTH=324 /DNA_ID=CAMNT_0042208267 /DNA_START=21 /DNA_END=991 /DNA_ORIENTATION=+